MAEEEEEERIRTYQMDLFPEYTVSMCLFRQVKNVPTIRQSLLNGELNCAFLNTSLIPGVLPVLLACNKSVSAVTRSCIRTRNLHSEILYNLSPSNSIKDSLRRFGLSDDHESFLCVCVRTDGEADGVKTVLEMAEGTVEPLDSLIEVCDSEKLKKLYKVTDEELSLGSMSDAVVMRVSTKDAL